METMPTFLHIRVGNEFDRSEKFWDSGSNRRLPGNVPSWSLGNTRRRILSVVKFDVARVCGLKGIATGGTRTDNARHGTQDDQVDRVITRDQL
ncbi:hypothetical protein Poly41_63050 [Novipirellula artificiosorum]|uniref:Uncharacterized protein n=1 Tax=Novipirellula artificiosorum TaxID=2528016 RepID=A0A5C6D5J4_9BACT|nr:hypothetical protein Poly41_63050 [Novipirellula artificiosorum]